MVEQSSQGDETRRRLATAAAWRVRLAEADMESSAAFETWLSEDVANEAAWRQVAEPWDTLAVNATDPEVMVARRMALARAEARIHTPAAITSRRGVYQAYRWPVAVAVVALALGAGWLLLRPAEYHTNLGERRVVTLDDGSRISLDSDSTVRVRYSDAARRLQLVQGQARFDAAHAANRPFSVDAGNRTVVATGTSFNIDLRRSEMVVTLIEGRVLVTSGASSVALLKSQPPRTPSVALAAGQALTVSTTASVKVPEPARVEAVKLDTVIAWEDGRLIFDDETLATVVERVGRYADEPITVADQRAAALRLSGVFNTGDLATFVDTVVRYLPVQAEQRPDGSIELRFDPRQKT